MELDIRLLSSSSLLATTKTSILGGRDYPPKRRLKGQKWRHFSSPKRPFLDPAMRHSAPRSRAVIFMLYPLVAVFTSLLSGPYEFYAAADYFPCWPKRPFSGEMAK